MRLFSARGITNALLAAAGAAALIAGCWRNSPEPSRPSATPAAAPADFVGGAACAECHPDKYERQSRTRHARTLRPLSRKNLGELAPPAGAIPGTGLVLFEKADRFAVGLPDAAGNVAPLQLALGSGKTGMTYVTPVSDEALAEFRLSYFPREKQVKWYVTPGHEGLSADSLGRVRRGEDARRCILCHAVALPPGALVPEDRFFGVGCESCHGPGSAHIDRMRAGEHDKDPMEHPGSWPATRLNALCGKCHGTEQDVMAGGLSRDMTNRLQTIGLAQSECFQQSKDTLSCITCHDPHTDVSTDRKAYEAVCLQCHDPTASANRSQQHLRTTTIVRCPVNPKEKCIGCHMPARRAIPNTPIPTWMADHFIRVYPPSARKE